HRTSAALAVGPGSVDHLYPELRVGQVFLEQAARSFQPEFDPEHLGGKQPVDGLVVAHVRGIHCPESGRCQARRWFRWRPCSRGGASSHKKRRAWWGAASENGEW